MIGYVIPSLILCHATSSQSNMAKVFRCVSFIYIHSQHQIKLDPKALKHVFLGYSSTQKGYKYYHPPTKMVFVNIHAKPLEWEPSNGDPTLVHSSAPNDNLLLPIALRKGKRTWI